MIGLYIKKFNIDFSPPENITSFYRNIFEVVATTHDRTKGGFNRKSASSLSQDKLELIFERFCFECYKRDQTVFTKIEFFEILKLTLSRLKIETCSPLQILDDFCNYLCLIAKDGLNYTFIHRSIFEYYVAFFFSKLNSENAEKIIPKISNYNILNFLKYLNIYYFNLFYLKNELSIFFNKFNIKPIAFNLKNSIPKSFLSIIKVDNQSLQENKIRIAITNDTLEYIQGNYYITKELITPLFQYISKETSVSIIYNDNYNKNETQNLHNRLNTDIEFKKIFQKIFEAYDQCISQIYTKENEITQDDFNDL